jgi:hypothetical protein
VSHEAALYSASQIARALKKKRQTVQQILSHEVPCGKMIVGGNEANAWTFAKLPNAIQQSLHSEAARGNYRNAEALLQNPCKRWEAPLSLGEIAQSNLDKASNLQTALRPLLEKQHALNSSQELERLGLLEYKKVFGHEISTRHWRRLFTRTIERDNGLAEWTRLEIYLDENPARKQKPISAKAPEEFRELQQVIANFVNQTAPTENETDYLWLRSIDFYQDKLSQGKTSKQAKRLLFPFLEKYAAFLAPTRAALLMSFNRRLQKLKSSGGKISALKDQRGANKIAIPSEDVDKIIFHARFNCGGRISQAWRELCERNELGEETLGRYLQNPTSKSYVPRVVRDLTKHEVKLLEDIHHGPRQAKLNGAFISRDWSKVKAGDWWQSDDCTLGIYTFIPDGKGWFTLIRGQFLPLIDLRSTRILNFAFLPERNYNARAIRTLITKTADEYGLPRKGFYFENGIWRNSKILKGVASTDSLSADEVETGLRGLGLKFVHAKLPRAKPIEGILGITQNLFDGEPGYAGRDERHDRYERFQKLKLQIERRKIHPSECLYTADQWVDRIAQACEQYNATPQNGKMTEGNSPDDAYFKFNNPSDPPTKLDANCRYLLASHKRPICVTGNGITLRFGKQVYNYKNEATGRLRGQRVLAWFDPEVPEVLTVTDMQRQNPFCVARSQEVPAMDAPAEILETELARNETHQQYAKTRYRVLKSKFAIPFRRNFVSSEVAELGRTIETQTVAVKEQVKIESSRLSKARKVYRDLGAPIPQNIQRAGTLENAERLQQLLNEPDES